MCINNIHLIKEYSLLKSQKKDLFKIIYITNMIFTKRKEKKLFIMNNFVCFNKKVR
jgi:hypothetical protein